MLLAIDPILVSLGPLSIRWYGLLYLLGFFLAFSYCYRYRNRVYGAEGPWTLDTLLDLFFMLP